jgi:hypothetical protein
MSKVARLITAAADAPEVAYKTLPGATTTGALQSCIYVPQSVVDAITADHAAYLTPFFILTKVGASTYPSVVWITYIGGAVKWTWESNTPGGGGGTDVGLTPVIGDAWAKIAIAVGPTGARVKINATDYGLLDSGDYSDVFRMAIGNENGSLVDTIYFDNTKLGTGGYGSDDVLSDDYESGSFSPDWTVVSGGAGTFDIVDNPGIGECDSRGMINHAFGLGR